MKTPLVSVVIPTFNRENDVLRAIRSVINQTHGNFEILVVDDGSTDNTKKNVASFIEELSSDKKKRIKYFFKENGGCASALNYGFRHANGELWCWLSADDYYEKTFLEKSVAAHNARPELGMTYARYTIVDPKGKTLAPYHSYQPTTRKDAIKKLMETCYINGSSMMVKKHVFYTIGFMNEFFRYAQDYDFYFRVLSKFDIALIEDYLLFYTDNTGVENKNWLGYEIHKGTHNNEAEIVKERYALMLDDGRPTVCAMLCIKNEQDLIEQCLDDLHMYVDKIVVFDDGSTDETPDLVRKWNKIEYILHQKPKGNVRTEGHDRQKLLEMAYYTGADWFLFIDADEVFEDRYKTEMWKEMKDKSVNLWFYKEINFWRGITYYRVDTLFDNGWFGRLFRNSPDLKFNIDAEHCGSIPNNIPHAKMWYCDALPEMQRKSAMRVKHYGFYTEERVLDKFRKLWERDASHITERYYRYERLIDERNLMVREYVEKPYYVNDKNWKKVEETFDGDEYGKSPRFKEELKKREKEDRAKYGSKIFEEKDRLREERDGTKPAKPYKKQETLETKTPSGTTTIPLPIVKQEIVQPPKASLVYIAMPAPSEILVEDEKPSFTLTQSTLEKKDLPKYRNILVVGDGNCFRSKYAESLLAKKGGFVVESCGIRPADCVHPVTAQVLKEWGVSSIYLTQPRPVRENLVKWAHAIISFSREFSCPKPTLYLNIQDATIDDAKGMQNSLQKVREALS